MTLRKAFAVIVIVFVLGFQIRAALPPGGAWYWPFMDYPMYSTPRHVGDSLIRYEVRAGPCEQSAIPAPLPHTELRMERFRLWSMLAAAAQDADDRQEKAKASADTIQALVRKVRPSASCSVQIWRQVLVIEPDGVRDFNQPWRPFRIYDAASRTGAAPASDSVKP